MSAFGKHRTLVRVGIAYLAVAWFIVQVLATLTPIYDLPGILVRGFAFMLVGGYPLVMMLAYVYQLTHRTRGWEAHNLEDDDKKRGGWIFNTLIISLVSLSIAILLLDLYVLRRTEPIPAPEPRVESAPQEEAALETEITESPYEKTVAVLPFTDLSDTGDQEYFSDGLSRGLISSLAMMPDLQVAGSESSFHYKGSDQVPGEIGKALQVANVLQGSVRKSGDDLRVTAQLVSAKDGFNIWSRSFDRKVADVFTIQGEIVVAKFLAWKGPNG